MSITTTTDLPAPIAQSLMEGMLAVPTASYNYTIAADKYGMPMKGGTTARFLRPRNLAPPIVPLGNTGIEPPSQIPQRDVLDAVMSFYGTSVILNEQVVIQDQDPVLSWVAERLAVAGKEGEDTILREYLLSAASVYDCQGGDNGQNPTNPVLSDFSTLNSQLDTNNAWKFVGGKQGEDRFGTNPIRASFLMLSHTLAEKTFDALIGNGFTDVWHYPNNADTMYAEYGSILNFRVLTSSNASISIGASSTGQDIFNNITTGRQGYAHIDQDGYSMQLLYRPNIFSGPLGLNSTLGIKFAQAQIITQDTWVSNFRFTAAA